MEKETRRGAPGGYAATTAAGPRTEEIPRVLSILPLRGSVLFPGGVLPVALGRRKSISLVQASVSGDPLDVLTGIIGVFAQRHAEEEDPDGSGLFEMGTVARLLKVQMMDEDHSAIVLQGLERLRVVEMLRELPYLQARVEPLADGTPVSDAEAVEALGRSLKKHALEFLALSPGLPPAAAQLVQSIQHPGHLADLIATNIVLPVEEKQAVLETVDLKARLQLVQAIVEREKRSLRASAKPSLP
jgi:ATP-dependent Lon protease